MYVDSLKNDFLINSQLGPACLASYALEQVQHGFQVPKTLGKKVYCKTFTIIVFEKILMAIF